MRRFQYSAKPEDIRHYLEALGYETVEHHNRYDNEPEGFDIVGTTISYDLIMEGKVVGHGLAVLRDSLLVPDPNNPYNTLTDDDPERYQRSVKLYRKLYRRFRKPEPSLPQNHA
jgi:hypothetical protein